jgi:dihydroneopterin aldolase
MDILFIREFEARAINGGLDWERQVKQSVVLNLETGDGRQGSSRHG